MAFLDQEINFDIGHFLLLGALIVFIFFMVRRCNMSCGNNEGLEIQPVSWKSCRCPNCLKAVYEQAKNGYLYGCDPNNPFVPYSEELCNNSYRKAALHGCLV